MTINQPLSNAEKTVCLLLFMEWEEAEKSYTVKKDIKRRLLSIICLRSSVLVMRSLMGMKVSKQGVINVLNSHPVTYSDKFPQN